MVGLVEAHEQADDGALARPRAADQAEHAAGRHRQADVLQHILAPLIAEEHLAELDRALDAAARRSQGRLREGRGGLRCGAKDRERWRRRRTERALRLLVEDQEDALRAGEGAGHPVEHRREPLQRTVEHRRRRACFLVLDRKPERARCAGGASAPTAADRLCAPPRGRPGRRAALVSGRRIPPDYFGYERGRAMLVHRHRPLCSAWCRPLGKTNRTPAHSTADYGAISRWPWQPRSTAARSGS